MKPILNLIRYGLIAAAVVAMPASSFAQTRPAAAAPARGADEPADPEAGGGPMELTPLPRGEGGDLSDLMDRRTEESIQRGLAFLKQSQGPSGHWYIEDSNHAAYTSLAMIAFMLNGHFPGDKQPYGPTMEKALDALLKEDTQDISGYMGTNMYSHGLATLALSEAWGQTDRDDEIKKRLKAAVDIILRSQGASGGWRYNPVPGDADVSVTAMQLVALSAARQAGILVPNTTIDKAVRYIHLCRDAATGGFTYVAGRGEPGMARSAAATFSLMMCGRHESPEVLGGIKYLQSLPATHFTKTSHYFYGHYYSALVMSMAGEEHFRAWYPQIRNVVLTRQKKDGSFQTGNPAYATSMGLIILSIPKGYVPAYQR